MTGSVKQAGIISDANVLIDYAKSAPYVLQLISKHVRKLYVPLSILREVDQLNESDIEKLGIEIIEPTLDQLIEAGQIRQNKPSVSGEDAICFVMARDNNWACLTNDKALRKYCSDCRITCLWGIGIMHHLVTAGKLTPEKALKIAQDIQSRNKYIEPAVIKRFQRQLGL
jgi:rRNA-processing protein FCF1